MSIFFFRAALLVGLAGGLLGANAAQAQYRTSTERSGAGAIKAPPGMDGADGRGAAARPRAVGVPGAQVDEESVTPSNRPASDMGPTEALFDAINRGDIVSARSAINRGADLRARSLLGFTPLELAVDLARKDIAFLLLSLRSLDTASGYRRDGGPAPVLSPAEQARAAQQEAQRQEAARRAAARIAPVAGPAGPQNPRLFAGDGGTPVPEAGFLGFGSATAPRTR